MKTVTLTTEMWQKIVRRLSVEVGANDESRAWADAITEQISGKVKVRVSGCAVEIKAGKGGDLRKFMGLK